MNISESTNKNIHTNKGENIKQLKLWCISIIIETNIKFGGNIHLIFNVRLFLNYIIFILFVVNRNI